MSTRIVAARLGLGACLAAGALMSLGNPISFVAFVAYGTMGYLLVVRRPRNVIGWLLLCFAAGLSLVIVTVPGTVGQFDDGTVDFPTALFAVVQGGSYASVYYLLAVLAMVFPSGRLPAARWGTLARASLGIGLVLVVATYLMPMISVSLAGYPAKVLVRNPIALLPDLGIWQVMTLDTSFFPVLVLVLAGAASLVLRLRRARGIEHQQLRWITAALALVVSGVLCGWAIGSVVPGSSESGLAWIPLLMAFPSVPLAVGIAVLRYRLYEIDRIVSRTIAYAIVTGILGATYAGIVLLLQGPLARFTTGNSLAVAASTLVVFALFQPLRRRVQSAIDRRFDRSRYDAGRIVADLNDRLRNEVELSTVQTEVIATVMAAVRPVRATVWLRAGTEGR
jgi:hypothetical protein